MSGAALAPEVTDPATATTRLLLVQQAGASLGSVFDLRCDSYAHWRATERMLRGRLECTRVPLIEALAAAIPEASDRQLRRTLLGAKRAVYNRRPVPAAPAVLGDEIRAQWDAYASSCREYEQAWRAARNGILVECGTRLGVLLQDDRFRLACRYASPDLIADLDRHASLLGTAPLSGLGLGVAAYAAKFIIKGNPFHVFAEVLLPDDDRDRPRYEIVLNLAMMMRIETRVLTANPDAGCVWMCLAPHAQVDDCYQFTITTERGLRFATLRKDSPAGKIVAVLDRHAQETEFPAVRREDFQQFCATAAETLCDSTLPGALAQLDRVGILKQYAITDWRRCASALSRLDGPDTPSLAVLQRHHLCREHADSLRHTHEALTSAAHALSEETRAAYFINTYSSHDPSRHQVAARGLYDDLRWLKPLFSVEHNFAVHAAMIASFAAECADGHSSRMAYLDLVRRFAQARKEALARHHPDRAVSRADFAAIHQWRNTLSAASCTLTRDQVRTLRETLPRPSNERHLCFKGPYDYVTGEFYISSVYAGDGRFAGRYLLDRPSPTRESRATAYLEVELAVPVHTNLTYVRPVFAVGTGFDARYAHAFRRWIQPSDIEVECSNGCIAYRYTPTGQRLKIHYRGFLLASHLPLQYQFLLADHADVFANPFVDRSRIVPQGSIRHRPPLSFGKVCLRRERWDVCRSLLDDVIRERDGLTFGVGLGRWLGERLAPEVSDWFYEPVDAGGATDRPRYLDLCNPFSVLAFRRAARRIPPRGGMSFTLMQPARGHLFTHDGEQYATELLIEV